MPDFIQLNTNFLETNVVNIFLLLALLFYVNTSSFKVRLAERQKEIEESLDKIEEDIVFASNFSEEINEYIKLRYVYLKEWRDFYDSEREALVSKTYQIIKKDLDEVFQNTENLLENLDTNAVANLKKQLLLLISGILLRKFLSLSKEKKAEVVKKILLSLDKDSSIKKP